VKVFFVSKRLAFGSAVTTWGHAEKLRALGITHIINLRWSQHNVKVRQFEHIWLGFHDDKKPRPRWFYRRALKFYKRAVKERRAKIFVMCHHGQCRSASLAYFFLRASGKSPRKAEHKIKSVRHTARVVPAYRETSEDYLRRKT
jgi:protein-tyrosine phosphatase